MNNFKNLRILENKTQTDIANYLGIKQSSYQNYENGLTEPNISNLCKLADLYSVSLDYLVGRPFNNEFGYLSNEEKTLIASFRKLSDYNQAKIVGEVAGILLTQD